MRTVSARLAPRTITRYENRSDSQTLSQGLARARAREQRRLALAPHKESRSEVQRISCLIPRFPFPPILRIAPRVAISRVANYSTATDKLDAPGSGSGVDPKIVSIVDQISGLTLLQTADLVSLLKVCEEAIDELDDS